MQGVLASKCVALLTASLIWLGSSVSADAFEGELVLAISWQPAFCETKSNRPECRGQTAKSFEATHFTLHGLWPQPRGNVYCATATAARGELRDRRWSRLPRVELSRETRRALERAMPGTQSNLERHQWAKHGSCYGTPAETYFRHALALLEQINQSGFQDFFAEQIGRQVAADRLQERFAASFGKAASRRLVIRCQQDGRRQIITELQLHLRGPIEETADLRDLMAAAGTRGLGCRQGTIDPVGLQ